MTVSVYWTLSIVHPDYYLGYGRHERVIKGICWILGSVGKIFPNKENFLWGVLNQLYKVWYTRKGIQGKFRTDTMSRPPGELGVALPPWRAGGLTEVAKGKMPFVICNTLLFWDWVHDAGPKNTACHTSHISFKAKMFGRGARYNTMRK